MNLLLLFLQRNSDLTLKIRKRPLLKTKCKTKLENHVNWFLKKKCLRYIKLDPERETMKSNLCVVVDLSSFCTFASSTTRKNSAISFSDTPFSFTNSRRYRNEIRPSSKN